MAIFNWGKDKAGQTLSDAKVEAARLISEANEKASEIISQATRISKESVETLESDEKKLLSRISKGQETLGTLLNDYDVLKKKIGNLEEESDFQEMCFYKPHFSFDISEKFKTRIDDNRSLQKQLLKVKNDSGAIYCATNWTVKGSTREGKKFSDRIIKLTARAFNGECDAAVASCSFKNIKTMVDRINKSFVTLNDLNTVNQVVISKKFLDLKLEELHLVYEYHEKKNKEREEQRELRESIAEERRAAAEIERAIRDSEIEEERAQRALQKAKESLSSASEAQRAKYESRIAELESALAESESKSERAKSMAQQTKRGHVYVISNIGSFGENVYKIGMTRRIIPEDRVDELSNASVPFSFDIHAMIKSEDAPALERLLHEKFESKRVNMINRRKEFFSVSLDEVKKAVYELAGKDTDFIETATARQYRETLLTQGK